MAWRLTWQRVRAPDDSLRVIFSDERATISANIHPLPVSAANARHAGDWTSVDRMSGAQWLSKFHAKSCLPSLRTRTPCKLAKTDSLLKHAGILIGQRRDVTDAECRLPFPVATLLLGECGAAGECSGLGDYRELRRADSRVPGITAGVVDPEKCSSSPRLRTTLARTAASTADGHIAFETSSDRA